jgi:hypothetical protein
MTVRATGRADGNRLYLNSEFDYRDQRNLSISIAPDVARSVLSKSGAGNDEELRGRKIVVEGRAERVRINFTAYGRSTRKYYYQTHVRVDTADQIEFR